ncbi:hypothetical protein ACFSSA_13605 [Luteolibacter algae]|uniref:Uncharacterized protein n=1 Tax=Luteolibacter algae TaxID=454151 RepID=A0ABW5D9D5_9BACT
MGHESLVVALVLVLFRVKSRYPNFLQNEAQKFALLLECQLSEEGREVGELLANDRLVGDEVPAVVDFHLELLSYDLQVALALTKRVGFFHEVR